MSLQGPYQILKPPASMINRIERTAAMHSKLSHHQRGTPGWGGGVAALLNGTFLFLLAEKNAKEEKKECYKSRRLSLRGGTRSYRV